MACALGQCRTPADAMREHLAVVQDLAGARLAFVSLWEPSKGQLAVAAVRGRADSSVAVARPGEGVIGRAFASGAIVGEPRGHLAIPLLQEEGALGVLSIGGARRQADDEVWRAIAAQLVAAVMAARLRDAAERRTRDLETAVAGLKSLEKARDELLGNVSHELKSPLTTIKAYLSMARKDRLGPLTDKQRRALETCDRNADRLLRLINDLLLMSRLQGGRMALAERPFGLRALAQEAAGLLSVNASNASVGVSVERASEVFVKGDRDRLLEALVHLLEHGVVNNRPGGSVTVSIGAEQGTAVLEVRDTGPGIHPEDLPNVFDRFWRGSATSAGGPGLGLAIVRQIVQLHGGSVSADSLPGSGTTFIVRLPLFAGAVRSDAPAAEPRDGVILLVEDDTDCREVLAQVLESEGLSVTAVSRADEALRFLAGARPALVLLDLRLGAGDGREVLTRVRGDSKLAETPVFVVSGAADSAAGFRYDGPERIDGFFEKPLNLPRLLDRIREVVRPAAQASGS